MCEIQVFFIGFAFNEPYDWQRIGAKIMPIIFYTLIIASNHCINLLQFVMMREMWTSFTSDITFSSENISYNSLMFIISKSHCMPK